MTRRILRTFSFSVEKKTMLFSPFDFVVLSSPNRVETRRLHLEQKYFKMQNRLLLQHVLKTYGKKGTTFDTYYILERDKLKMN